MPKTRNRNEKRYKSPGKCNLFDGEQTKEELKHLGNPLARLSDVIDFEMFREPTERKFYASAAPIRVGAPPFDVV